VHPDYPDYPFLADTSANSHVNVSVSSLNSLSILALRDPVQVNRNCHP